MRSEIRVEEGEELLEEEEILEWLFKNKNLK